MQHSCVFLTLIDICVSLLFNISLCEPLCALHLSWLLKMLGLCFLCYPLEIAFSDDYQHLWDFERILSIEIWTCWIIGIDYFGNFKNQGIIKGDKSFTFVICTWLWFFPSNYYFCYYFWTKTLACLGPRTSCDPTPPEQGLSGKVLILA